MLIVLVFQIPYLSLDRTTHVSELPGFPNILMLITSVSLLPAIKLRPQSEEDVEVKVSFAVNAKEGRNRGSQGIEKTASGQGNKRLALEKIQRTVQA